MSPSPEASGGDLFKEVRLVDAEVAAAIGGMGTSWWYEKVRSGEAPKPVIRGVRCSRWRAVDVAEFWRSFAEAGGRVLSLNPVGRGGDA